MRSQKLPTEHAPKYFSRDKGTAITFRSEAVVIETTRYENYERFRDLVRLAIRARQKADPVDGVVRLGLQLHRPKCGCRRLKRAEPHGPNGLALADRSRAHR